MASAWMWAGPTTVRGHIPETGRTLRTSGSKPTGADPAAASREPQDTSGSLSIWTSRPAAAIRTTRTFLPGRSSRHTGFSPKDPGSKPTPLAPDPTVPPVPVRSRAFDPPVVSSSSRSSKSSLGFISTPLIWPGRKRPSRGGHLLTTRVPTGQVANVTKPTAKPTDTPKHSAFLRSAHTPEPTQDLWVAGQGSEEAEPPLPSLAAVSSRENHPVLPTWFLENQTFGGGVVDENLSLPELDYNRSRFSLEDTIVSSGEPIRVPPVYTDTGTIRPSFTRPNKGPRHLLHGSEVPSLDSGVLSQTLVSFVLESSLSSDLQGTGHAGASLPASVTPSHTSVVDGLLFSEESSDTTAELQMFSRTGEHLQSSSLPPQPEEPLSVAVWTPDPLPLTGGTTARYFAGVTPTLTRFDRPGDPRPPTGVHQSELTVPHHVIQTHPVPLCPGSFCLPQTLPSPSIEPSFSLTLSSLPLPSSLHLTHHHMTPSGAPSSPEATAARPGRGSGAVVVPNRTGLDFPAPTPGSTFPSSSPTHDVLVLKLRPPADITKPSIDAANFKNIPVSNRTVWTTLKDSTKAKTATAEAARTDEPQVTTKDSEAAPRPSMNLGAAERPTASRLESNPGQSTDSWTGSTASPDGLVRDLSLTLAPLVDERHFPATTKSSFPPAPVKTAGDGSGSIKDTAPPVSASGTAKHWLKCPCKQRSQCQCGRSPGNSTCDEPPKLTVEE